MRLRKTFWILVMGALVWVTIITRAPLALVLISAVILAVGTPIAGGNRPIRDSSIPAWLPYAVLALPVIVVAWAARWVIVQEGEAWELLVCAILLQLSVVPGLIFGVAFWVHDKPIEDYDYE